MFIVFTDKGDQYQFNPKYAVWYYGKNVSSAVELNVTYAATPERD